MKDIDIYTDGACIGNPGPGGYAAILRYGAHERLLFAGYRLTTNNRMELLAAIAGLSALKEPCHVSLHSDSQYLVRMMQGGWPRKWRGQGWMRSRSEKASNPDLWESLLTLCDRHQVDFIWVRGHTGHAENERCDRLAITAARGEELLVDVVFEKTARQEPTSATG